MNNLTAHDIAKGLEGARKSGKGWTAKCPAHKDTRHSFSISDGRNGSPVFHCFTGCPPEDIMAALTERGLWGGTDAAGPKPYRPPYRLPNPAPAPEIFLDDEDIVATFDYTDEAGRFLYQIARWNVPYKTFRPRVPDGRGGWFRRKHKRIVLYRLPEVIANEIVFLVEGEKDADTLAKFGFCGTTAPFGAGTKWDASFTEFLCGKVIVLLPDNDGPGLARVDAVARQLVGVATELIYVHLGGAPGEDISDWFAAGHSEVELHHLVYGDDDAAANL